MADSQAGTGKIQDDPGASFSIRKYGSTKIHTERQGPI